MVTVTLEPQLEAYVAAFHCNVLPLLQQSLKAPATSVAGHEDDATRMKIKNHFRHVLGPVNADTTKLRILLDDNDTLTRWHENFTGTVLPAVEELVHNGHIG